MSNPVTQPTPPRSSLRVSRNLYWFVIVSALIALGFSIYDMRHFTAAGHPRPFAWLAPTGILCLGIGGIFGERRPGLQRLLIGLSAILVVAGLVEVIRRV